MEHVSFIKPGIFSLYSIKKTQIEMMLDRGYNISKKEKKVLNMSEKRFNAYYRKLLNGDIDNEWIPYLDQMMLPEDVKYTQRTVLGNVYTNQDKSKKCLVVYVDQEGGQYVVKVITDAIIVMVEGINTGIKYDEVILITKIPFSVAGRDCINDLKYTSHWIFLDKELCFNVTKHSLVPQHSLLPEKEAEEFKRKYRHHEQISVLDPVVKYYGWKEGGVVKIIRDISSIDSMVKLMVAKRLIVGSNIVNDSKK